MRKAPMPGGLPIAGDVTIVSQVDLFLDLRKLSKLSSLIVKTLRHFLHHPTAPLPHYRLAGKILVRLSEFEQFLEAYRASPAVDIERVVDELVKDLRTGKPLSGSAEGHKRRPRRRTGRQGD
jgi:hypothetical protein